MWLINLVCGFSYAERWALGVILGVFVLFFALGLRLDDTGLYLSGGALVFGVLSLVPVFFSRGFIGCVFLSFGVGFLSLSFLLSVLAIKKRRKEEKKEALRKTKFILPDRQNTYLCARLHTALQPQKEAEVERERMDVRPDYAWRLLEGLKNAQTSTVERLETEELSGALALYEKKERLTKTELSALGEVLARVIKLSAKYEIPV